MEVCTDNNPFNSVEFKQFSTDFDFSHITSSPHYAQNRPNGKAENGVKTAKRLMEKAIEDKQDPFLALLTWRNTPSEQLGCSPAQIIFGRRTRTHLPMTVKMLQSNSGQDDIAKGALMKAKLHQKAYYDVHSCMHPQTPPGSTVRTRWNKNEEWKKAKVVEALPRRSFKVQFTDGTIRR
jgi:hypothetical protein